MTVPNLLSILRIPLVPIFIRLRQNTLSRFIRTAIHAGGLIILSQGVNSQGHVIVKPKAIDS